MPKNVYFFRKKAMKSPQRWWGTSPPGPKLLLPLTDIDLSKSAFLALKLIYYFEKYTQK